MNWTTAEESLAHLRSGMRVFIGSGCAAPQKLVAALAARGREIFNVEIVHILTFGARGKIGSPQSNCPAGGLATVSKKI
jgi:hypothetical protein